MNFHGPTMKQVLLFVGLNKFFIKDRDTLIEQSPLLEQQLRAIQDQ